MVIPEPGNTLTTAYNLGTLANTQILSDSLSSGDRDDFYRFTLSSASSFNLAVTGLSADANVRLLRDANNNGKVEASEVIASSNRSGTADESINRQLNAGTYYIQVSYGNGNTNYTLNCSTANPSNLLPVETNIGSLSNRTYSYSNSVGSTNTADIYRFSIANDQSFGFRDIRVALHWLNGNANVDVIRDGNDNGIVDAGEVIQGSYASGNTNELIDLPGLGGGTYFIRVYSADNTPANYTLDLTAVKPIFDPENQPDRGDSLPQAYYLGTLNGDRFVGGTVSVIDNDGNGDQDFYRFTLGTTSNLAINIGNWPGDTIPFNVFTSVIRDANRNGVEDSGDVLAATGAHIPAYAGNFISLPGLGAGDYFVKVSAFYGYNSIPPWTTSYFLQLNATPGVGIEEEPNNSLQQAQTISVAALDFGSSATLNGTRQFSGFVGSSDPNDYYRFSLESTSNVSFSLSGLTQNANLQLIRDSNSNGAIDVGDVLQGSYAAGSAAESIKALLGYGTYFVRAYAAAGANTNYVLSMTGKPLDENLFPASNLLTVETNIGSLANRTYTYSDRVSSTDPLDIYRFSLVDTRDIRVSLHWLNGNANVEVIRDANNNGVVDTGEVIKGSYATGNTNELIDLPGLGAGTYLIRVYSVDNATANYTLDLTSVQPNWSAPNQHEPNGSLSQAYYLGTLNGDRFVGGTVSVLDYDDHGDQDFYCFTLGTTSNLAINIGNGPGDTVPFYVLTSVIRDANRNGIVDSEDVLEATTGEHIPAYTGSFISLPGLGAGDYFVKVYATTGISVPPLQTEYFLKLSATPGTGTDAEPDNSLQQAQNISFGSLLNSVVNLNGTRQFRGFVGSSDPNDYYHFNLATPDTVSFALTGLTQNANLELIWDANNNHVIDSGDMTWSSSDPGISSEAIFQQLQAGSYFVRVYGASVTNTPYLLTMHGNLSSF